jgi:hypothetical protein
MRPSTQPVFAGIQKPVVVSGDCPSFNYFYALAEQGAVDDQGVGRLLNID